MPITEQVPVTELNVGDVIDADDLHQWLSDAARMHAESEYVTVEHHDNETPECTVLGLMDGHYGIPADTLVHRIWWRGKQPSKEAT